MGWGKLKSADSTDGKEWNFLWEKRHSNLAQVVTTCDDLQLATISCYIGGWHLKIIQVHYEEQSWVNIPPTSQNNV